MAQKEIKQRIVLDGEKQYSQAIKEAQRNLRTLRSELKAETAELGNNATAQQKNEAKAKSLKAQIAEQEKVVQALRGALDEVKEKYGSNADEVARWQQRLNNARAVLAGMENDLENTGEDLRGIGEAAALSTVATKSLADSFGRIAEAGAGISEKIESIFQGMVDVVRESISAVWGDLMDLAARANEWGDVAGMWNTDAANVEKWARATKAATGDFNTMLTAVQKINDLNDKQQKKVAEYTGVSGANYADRWEYAMAVVEAMSRLDYGKQLEASEEIFGAKRAGGIIDLLNDWGNIKEKLGMFDAENGGLGLTNEQLDQMVELDIRVHTIKETWRAFVDEFEAKHLAQLGLDLTGGAQTILEDLIKYLDSGSDEDLQQLEADITAFFDRVVAAIEAAAEKLGEAGKKLEESDNGIVKAIGIAMSGLATALQWLAEPGNIDLVIQGFEALAAFWAAGKGLSLVSTIAQLAANFQIISGGSAALGALGAGGGGGGIGGLLSGAGYLAVGIMMVAPTVQKLFDPKTWQTEDPQMKKIREKFDETTPGDVKDEMLKSAGITNQDILRSAWGRLTGNPDMIIKPNTEAPEAGAVIEGDGIVIPRAGGRKFDVTEAQRSAAEIMWDNMRIFESTGGVNEGSFDKAWDAFEAAFAGNEGVFDRLNSMMDKLMEQLEVNGEDPMGSRWKDLPAEWWMNGEMWRNGANNGQQLTGADLAGFRGLPAQMVAAVQAGAAAGASSGVSGISVQLDGATVGRMVSPYVSEIIARDIVG